MDIAPNAPFPQFWEMAIACYYPLCWNRHLFPPLQEINIFWMHLVGWHFHTFPMSMFLHLPLLKATDLIGLITTHDSFTNEDIYSTLPEETTTLKQLFRAQEISETCGRFGRGERDKSKTLGDILTLFSLPFITGHKLDVLMDYSKQKHWLKLWFRSQEPWLIKGTMASHQIFYLRSFTSKQHLQKLSLQVQSVGVVWVQKTSQGLVTKIENGTIALEGTFKITWSQPDPCGQGYVLKPHNLLKNRRMCFSFLVNLLFFLIIPHS